MQPLSSKRSSYSWSDVDGLLALFDADPLRRIQGTSRTTSILEATPLETTTTTLMIRNGRRAGLTFVLLQRSEHLPTPLMPKSAFGGSTACCRGSISWSC